VREKQGQVKEILRSNPNLKINWKNEKDFAALP